MRGKALEWQSHNRKAKISNRGSASIHCFKESWPQIYNNKGKWKEVGMWSPHDSSIGKNTTIYAIKRRKSTMIASVGPGMSVFLPSISTLIASITENCPLKCCQSSAASSKMGKRRFIFIFWRKEPLPIHIPLIIYLSKVWSRRCLFTKESFLSSLKKSWWVFLLLALLNKFLRFQNFSLIMLKNRQLAIRHFNSRKKRKDISVPACQITSTPSCFKWVKRSAKCSMQKFVRY